MCTCIHTCVCACIHTHQCKHMHLRICESAHLCPFLLLRRLLLDSCNHTFLCTYTTDDIPHHISNQRLRWLSPSLHVAALLSCSRLLLTPPHFTPPQFAIQILQMLQIPSLHSSLLPSHHTHHFTSNHPTPTPTPTLTSAFRCAIQISC